ncbi:MAG: ribosome biogenesis GTPase YlqF [Clostridia bacterium]|nr:ribosome biogenesis GTPase YlqF [Clostridia bacterium]
MADSIKQTVQWFPGHMAKTRRLIKECLPQVDAVTEVLDARVPESSRNPELSDLIGDKPRIVLLNKCDVADDRATKQWVAHYQKTCAAVLPVDCKSGKGLNQFVPLMREVLKEKIEKNEARGMAGKPLRIMVVGIPNTGKSSFINKMAGRNRAEVADKAGVTRHNRWFVIGNGMELLDTPGVLWPKFDDPKVGDKLAFIGSVKDTVVDCETLAVRLLEIMQTEYADRLSERYKISDFVDLQPWELLELIGRKRGMIIKGGEVDYTRVSVMLLDEYRGGKLGKITLDRVGD